MAVMAFPVILMEAVVVVAGHRQLAELLFLLHHMPLEMVEMEPLLLFQVRPLLMLVAVVGELTQELEPLGLVDQAVGGPVVLNLQAEELLALQTLEVAAVDQFLIQVLQMQAAQAAQAS